MKTTETEIRVKPAITLCYILSMPVKQWFLIITLVLLFMFLCMVVFAGESGQQSSYCDLQSGSLSSLNLSREQHEKMRQLSDGFRKDTAITRGKIIEKRLELKSLSENPKPDPHAINKAERKLNSLEHEFSRKAQRTETDQRRVLTPEQIHKMKGMPYGYGSQGYGRKRYGGR